MPYVRLGLWISGFTVAVAVAVFRFSEFTVEIAVAVAVFGNFYSGHKISGFVETHSCNIAASQF